MESDATRRPLSPRTQARSRRTHERLLLAGAAEIARVGYENASLVRMSKEAGVTTGALYNHFPSKWALAEELLQEQHEQVQAIAVHVEETLPTTFERLLCFSADMSELIMQRPSVRAGLQLSTEPALPLEAPVWRGWADLADGLVATSRDTIDTLRVTQQLGSLTVMLLVSAWFLTRDQDEAAIDELLQPMWSALAAGIVHPERGASALASVASLFGR